MLRCVTNGTGVDEKEVTLVVHHGVARVQITVEGAQPEHERPVDAKEFKHVGPGQGARFEVVFEGRVGDFLHDQHAFVGEVLPHGGEFQFRHGKMLLDVVGSCDELTAAIDFVEEVQFSNGVVFDVGQQAEGVANLPKLWTEEQTHSNPTFHSLDVLLEVVFKIGFDDFHHHLGSVLEDAAVDLADAGRCKRLHVEVLKMVEKPFGGKSVQQAL